MYSILTIWKERNNISFDDEKNSIHRLKHSFLCNIWTWSKLFLVFSPPSVVDFVDWLGLLWEGRCFLLPLYFGGALRQLLYVLCVLWGALYASFVYDIPLLYSSNIYLEGQFHYFWQFSKPIFWMFVLFWCCVITSIFGTLLSY